MQQEDERRLRYGSSIPAHMRHQHRPGQVIETEENLSDKEIYPNNNMSIPAIGQYFSFNIVKTLLLMWSLFIFVAYLYYKKKII